MQCRSHNRDRPLSGQFFHRQHWESVGFSAASHIILQSRLASLHAQPSDRFEQWSGRLKPSPKAAGFICRTSTNIPKKKKKEMPCPPQNTPCLCPRFAHRPHIAPIVPTSRRGNTPPSPWHFHSSAGQSNGEERWHRDKFPHDPPCSPVFRAQRGVHSEADPRNSGYMYDPAPLHRRHSQPAPNAHPALRYPEGVNALDALCMRACGVRCSPLRTHRLRAQ
ncbi:hypothetical protein VUR80DRAFT_6572 [Thermomyces stellatus]